MLAYLEGQLLTHTKDGGIILVNNLGYEVIGAWIFRENPGTTLSVYTYQYYENENIPRLIGTETLAARDFLIELMTVQGVGPKMASRILDAADIPRLKTAITQGDVATLKLVKGLGLKTAQKIILELGKKLVNSETSANSTVYQALQELGFSRSEIEDALQRTDTTGLTENNQISAVLKNLGRAK